MANDESHDTRTTVPEDRVAAAVSLSVAGVVATLAQGALTEVARRFTVTKSFEGVVGTDADDGADGFDGTGGRSIFSDEQKVSGTTSGKMTILQGETGFGNWGGEFDFPNKLYDGDELFLRFRMYYPSGFTHYTSGEGDRVKFVRVKSTSPANANRGYLDLYWDKSGSGATYKQILEFGSTSWTNVGTAAEFPHLFDQWVTYNIHYVFNADSTLGIARFWRNGELMADIKTETLSAVDDSMDFIYLFTYWNGSAPQTQSCYTDDWKITSDRNETVIDPVTGFPWIGV
jgi:hypothetical protein